MRAFAIALALLWALCVFLQSLPAGLSLGGGYTRPPLASSAPQAPRGLEYRRVNRLGRRLVAVRVQVIVC